MRALLSFVPIAACLLLAPSQESASADSKDVVIRAVDKHIDLFAGDVLVGRYHIDPALTKPHFHPLNGPYGAPITRGFPMIRDDPGEAKDHPHQRGRVMKRHIILCQA